jgi:predicted transcriptional regulator of viral defense system
MWTEKHSVVQIASRIPNGVVCLLSALLFHNLTTQLPHKVWLAIDRKAWKPKSDDIPVRTVRFSGPALTEGIETHIREGVEIKVYCIAKTVADCFKYRNKIGLDVALEALREYIRNYARTRDELWKYAKMCRVDKVLRPYLEAMS